MSVGEPHAGLKEKLARILAAGDEWIVYERSSEKAAAQSQSWMPRDPGKADSHAFYPMGAGDDSNDAGFNFRYMPSLRHWPDENRWRLDIAIIYQDDPGGDPLDDDEDPLVECWTIAELITSEHDAAEAVRRLMSLYIAVRGVFDWSYVEPDAMDDATGTVVQEAFFRAEAEFYKNREKERHG